MLNRRDFLRLSGATMLGAQIGDLTHAAASARGDPGEASGSGWIRPIGLQLYTVRNALSRDFDATLAQVARIGYREVELAGLFGRGAASVRRTLDEVGLMAPSTHIGFEDLTQSIERALDDAHTLGHRYIVVPAPPADLEHRPSVSGYERFADQMNRIAESVAAAGATLCYHNHDFEFRAIDRQVPYDILTEKMDRRVVLEVDLYWMIHAGRDPLEYFARWPGRIRMVHVKDTVGPPTGAMTDVGAGITDWRRIFAQHSRAGIEHYFVENDDALDGLKSAAVSFSYLRNLTPLPP